MALGLIEDIDDLVKQFANVGVQKDSDFEFLDENSFDTFKLTTVSRKLQSLIKGLHSGPSSSQGESSGAGGASSDLAACLCQIGIHEADVPTIAQQFNKPEYGVASLAELFALDDDDVDEILRNLPLGKRKLLKMAISREK